MKFRIQSLLLLITFAAAIFSCSDDDDDKKPSNVYVFNGKKIAPKAIYFADNTHEDGGGFDFWFSPGEGDEPFDDELPEYIWIEIPKERMGTKFELTEEDPYNWSWWLEVAIAEGELFYEGFGGEDQMEDVKSGTISTTVKGENKFVIEIDIVFIDGKTLKLNYSGEMVNAGDMDSRKSASIQRTRNK